METITHSQVQDLVKQLPAPKLPLVYNLLADLTANDPDELSPQLDFMRLPLSERRRIMAQQAAQMVAHYEPTVGECQIKHGAWITEKID